MSELRPPYKTHLRSTVDDDTRDRMWRRIEARHGATKAAPSTLRWILGGAAAAVVVVGLWRATFGAPSHETAPAPVAVASAPAAPNDVVIAQGVGTRHYDVTAGPRHVVDAGLATLTFDDADVSVERAEHSLHLQVRRGDVWVQSAHIKGGTAHLSAGMLLDVDDEPMPSASVAPSSAAAPVAHPAPWKALAAQGKNPEAYAALGPGGVAEAARTASVDELLTLADVARLSGHPTEAVDPLTRVVHDHPTDGRASLAAFTLGRVDLDALSDFAGAARALEQAIALGLPGGLEEDAYARLVEAKSKAGDAAGASAAYERARGRFPNGSRDADMRRWIDPK